VVPESPEALDAKAVALRNPIEAKAKAKRFTSATYCTPKTVKQGQLGRLTAHHTLRINHSAHSLLGPSTKLIKQPIWISLNNDDVSMKDSHETLRRCLIQQCQ
jgi:hypothetical protein